MLVLVLVLRNCAVTVASTGAENQFQADDNGHVKLFYGKRSFSVTTPCASPTRVDTERLAERETLLHRLGSKLIRIV